MNIVRSAHQSLLILMFCHLVRPDYVPKIIELVKNNELQVLMPWSDEEATTLSEARHDLSNLGCTVLVSPPDVMQTITDKSKTYDMIKAAGLKVPEYTVVS